MNSAASLLAFLQARGFHLEAQEETIRYRPRQAMTAAMLERLRARKAELLALLARGESHVPTCPNCGHPLDAKARCWKCCEWLCSGCGRATGSAFIELCWPCGFHFVEDTHAR